MNRAMDLYLRFASNWYKPRFIEVVTQPTSHLQLAPVVNSMLAGNIKRSFTTWSRMELFYLVTLIQRFVPLCPRVSLIPKSKDVLRTNSDFGERKATVSASHRLSLTNFDVDWEALVNHVCASIGVALVGLHSAARIDGASHQGMPAGFVRCFPVKLPQTPCVPDRLTN